MKQLVASISAQCSDWDIYYETDDVVKLRRNLHAENKSCLVCVDLTFCFDPHAKLFNIVFSTPS